MRRLSLALALGTLLPCPARPIRAQQGECATIAASAASMRPIDRLGLLSRTGCLGGIRDVDALTRTAMKVLPARQGDTASRTEIRLVVLSALDPVMKATSLARDNAADGSPQRVMLGALDSSVAFVRAAVETRLTLTSTDTGSVQRDKKLLDPHVWDWDTGQEAFHGLPLQLASTVKDACTTATTARCMSAVQTAEFVLRATRLVARSLTFYSAPIVTAALARTSKRDAQWTAYFDETLVQFPWELALNSARFTRAARARAGFAMPPRDQWVWLHPMAGVEYVWSAPQGSRMTPAVAMEVLGYNRWSWNAKNKPAGALGASIVAAFSDRANADNVGYGLLVRYAHKYSLSVTSRGGRTGLLLSSDFGTWLSGKQDQARNAMRLNPSPE